MSLSICLITADPPTRIATILEPLREHASEIVIAADSRVDAETLAAYASLADRIFRIEFRMVERHLGWLYAQCSGDWILGIDGDEVPSQAFIRRLPDLLASREAQQFWISVAWLFPDANRMLASMPWSQGFINRLVRNDGTLRVRGLQHLHSEPVTPCEYVGEPFYHLELLIANEESRRDKAVRYEVSRPYLRAPGGGRINEAFYLPELRDSLELLPVPEEDKEMITRALDRSSQPSPQAPIENVEFISLKEMDRHWEGRAVSEGTYRAKIKPFASNLSLAPAEQGQIFVYVVNEGTERWPGHLEEAPRIRLSHRWLDADGKVYSAEGPRSPFSRAVDPHERILTPLSVDAPTIAGDYTLEVDVVHEDVRWFDCACRVPVHVGYPRGLRPAKPRLRETPPVRHRRWRKVRIPEIIHRVWLGDRPMPIEHQHFAETFVHHHPHWEMMLWTDDDLPKLGITEGSLSRSASELSNVVRYEVLRQFGGIYVDTDVECRRSFTPLLRGIDAFAALEAPGRVGSAVLGSTAGHPVFARAAILARRTLGVGAHSADANGPYFLSLLLEQEPSVTILGAELFYPYRYDEPERRHETFPDAYAVHHWTTSWQTEEMKR
ncbi:MAG TPA: glycosyltransferase [Solirubrobacteraceae bacterium]